MEGVPRCSTTLAVLSIMIGAAASDTRALEGAQVLPRPLVYLRDIDPTIVQDIRYASVDNFTGKPVPGYEIAECVLVEDVARALARVQRELARRGKSLKVYDCYRPERAVRAFMAWIRQERDDGATRRFYPNLAKMKLNALGYIAARSGHSRGAAVDLTIVPFPLPATEQFDPARVYGACTGVQQERAPDSSVDMGTGYDCFDVRSHTAHRAISADQRAARQLLVSAMAQQGFANYSREWWHFSLESAAAKRSFDVPIRARGLRVDDVGKGRKEQR